MSGPLEERRVTAVFDETHTHTDKQLRDAVNDIVQRRATAEFEQREARLRGLVQGKLREHLALHLEGHRGISKQMASHVYDCAAAAAADFLVDLLRNPPTIEHHPDGTETIRWPEDTPDDRGRT
jgi:hypothetical protein